MRRRFSFPRVLVPFAALVLLPLALGVISGISPAHAAAQVQQIIAGGYAVADGAAPTAATAGQPVRALFTTEGVQLVRQDHPNRIRCTVTVSTATTLTAVGAPCAAPGAGLSIYVTDITFAASASGIAADAFPTLKYGTGGACGTGTTVFWGALTAAAVVAVDNRTTPIKIPANNEICWITSTAGSKFVNIGGYIAP